MNRRVHGGKVVTYVGADDADGGSSQGEELVKALGPKGGKIIYLQGTPCSSPQVSRERGLNRSSPLTPKSRSPPTSSRTSRKTRPRP